VLVAVDAGPAYRWHVRSWGGPTVPDAADRSTHMTHCRHWLHRWVCPEIYSLAALLGGLKSTINAATICIAAAKANGTT
jgi:hypothetical protein